MDKLRGLLLVIPLTILAAFVLTILPLPDWAIHWRPEWVAMTVIYWNMALPRRVGVGTAWILGLLLDVTKGALLGQHALAMALIAWISIRVHQRIRVYPLWQQAITVGALLALFKLMVLWVYGITGHAPGTWLYWAPVAGSILLWPLIFVLLRRIRRRWCLSLA
ncbi:rod shape-determining protein MreD [Ectothiorhodospira lacustris]|uniref:rod shape-determining protein MreD n=1 Tax=Ectothiorhodospira lacustris TaxID=2899127 RepID=UPI001EE867D6|nr:rod shape-determining protein MreD [Ectothiorhodospira lacustris]MCG5500864.1 rod shape-determining protein MreD [Ectothiorhodospira lacustris]MCG5511402.1 rod shape-determining protein MreD [Ectothiorhodospira lacustris]MCG5523197.1 rod shape-determining protein MreD [Ectothiorhodospira lacustris]